MQRYLTNLSQTKKMLIRYNINSYSDSKAYRSGSKLISYDKDTGQEVTQLSNNSIVYTNNIDNKLFLFGNDEKIISKTDPL